MTPPWNLPFLDQEGGRRHVPRPRGGSHVTLGRLEPDGGRLAANGMARGAGMYPEMMYIDGKSNNIDGLKN